MNTHETRVHIHNKFLEGYVKILIMAISGWARDGGLDICEKEKFILQHFFILWFSGGGMWTNCIHYIDNEKQLIFKSFFYWDDCHSFRNCQCSGSMQGRSLSQSTLNFTEQNRWAVTLVLLTLSQGSYRTCISPWWSIRKCTITSNICS